MRRFTSAAGKYRTRVSIWKPSRSLNGINESVAEYTTLYCKRWAQIVQSSGREFVSALAVNPEISLIMRMRSDSETREITPDMRITIGDRTINIAAVYDRNEERKEVELWCTEVA